MKFHEIFPKGNRIVIGMVHCLPLPGTAGYRGSMEEIVSQALADARTLEDAGVNGLIVENMGDAPFFPELDTAQTAALAAVSALVRREVKIPMGIDAAMNDYRAALSVAHAVGAQFVRIPVFVDTVEFYGGVIKPCAAKAMRYRRQIGAEEIAIFADVQVKHTHMLVSSVSVESSAKTAVSCGADAIIVTGTHIGVEAPIEIVRRVKDSVQVPLIVASGLSMKNAAEQMRIADAAIVGTNLKEGGVLTNPVSRELTEALIRAVG